VRWNTGAESEKAMKKITKWREINTEDDLLSALADVKATPYGNVGQHIGYRVTEKARRDMKNWNFEDRLNASYILKHPHPRIDTGKVSFKDIGGELYKTVTSYTETPREYERSGETGLVFGFIDASLPRGRTGIIGFLCGVLAIAWVMLLARYGANVSTELFCYPPLALLFVGAVLAWISRLR
jgi:hypothetical protein